jgi:hypothetical protein
MTSTFRKAIPVIAGLLLLADSPAFAARHNDHQKTHKEVATIGHQLFLSSSRSDNSSPYIVGAR